MTGEIINIRLDDVVSSTGERTQTGGQNVTLLLKGGRKLRFYITPDAQLIHAGRVGLRYLLGCAEAVAPEASFTPAPKGS